MRYSMNCVYLCLSSKQACHTLLPLEKLKYGKLDTHQTNKKNDKLHSFWPVAQNFSLPFFLWVTCTSVSVIICQSINQI